MTRTAPQLLVFTYHKTGTSLFLAVMSKVSALMGLRLVNLYGPVGRLPVKPDVLLLAHSLLYGPLPAHYRAVRVVRDPRDVWVSGYLYHRHCKETWCVNTAVSAMPPVLVPKIDYPMVHWPEAAKIAYMERLGGRSYQANLLERSREDGLDFELAGYTATTLAAMEFWPFDGAGVLDVRLEDLMADFDAAMARVFAHFGFSEAEIAAAMEVAREEDVGRMDDAAVDARPQIHSRVVSKWRDVLSEDQVRRFEVRYGGLIRRLGYAVAG